MGLHIIHDSDTVTRELDGDKLVLLTAPRQRDVDACETLERKEAFAAMGQMREAGIDPDTVLKEAEAQDPEVLKAAQEAATGAASPAIFALQLKALAVALYVDGEKLGGDAILKAYQEMDAASATWVREQVASVWSSALPSEVDTRG